MRTILSKRASVLGALALALATWAAPVSAAELTFDQLIDGGTLSYGGNLGDPLVGTAIRFDTISDGGGVSTTLECRGCTLTFTTGGSTSESAGVNTYAGSGSFVVTGSAYSGADLDPTTLDGVLQASGILLTGSFTSGVLVDGGSQLTFNGFGIDTKNQDLLDYFGITDTNFTFANTDISTTTSVNITNAFRVNVAEADITNTSVAAPEPASLVLFGTVMLAGARAFRRRSLVKA